MDELLLLRMTMGGGSGLDITALLAFIAFAAVYFLAPRVTNSRERPPALALALYLMVGYAAISLGQLLLQWSTTLNGGGFRPHGAPVETHLLFACSALKMALMVIAMIAFVAGLQTLRFKDPETRAFEQAVDKLQQLRDENIRLRKRLEQDATRDDDGV